jgi:hypothetical protein
MCLADLLISVALRFHFRIVELFTAYELQFKCC